MADMPNDAAVQRAVAAAKGALSPEDAAKLERFSRNKDSLRGLTSNLSQRDWAQITKVINDPVLLKRVLSSPQGKNMLHDFLKRVE